MYVYSKKNVGIDEYRMYKYVLDLQIVNIPPIINYNQETKQLDTLLIDEMNIADLYGDDPDEVPKEVFSKIRNIIIKLYENNVIYPDITGYNFIKTGDNIWIVDFEHSRCIIDRKEANEKYPFVYKFINGFNGWNPYFK